MATGSINLNANLTLNTQSLNAASKQAQQALGRITGQASEFQKSLDASTARVFAFGATTSILNGVSQAFKSLISNTIEVEKRINEIGSILGGTNAELNALRNTVFAVAKDTGQAFGTVADAAAELARQGLSAEETSKRLSAALVLTRVSGLDSVKSVKALTSAINGFTSAGLTAEQITNKLVAVDTKFAVSAQDLAEGFSRAGSTAEDAGVSFDELLGIITAVEQKTARGGAVIGNALKSIFARLGRGKVIDDLRELGVEIDSSQTGIQKLQALSTALENVADPTVASKIKELAGGVFQINVVSAALKDLGSDTSIFAQAAKTAVGATNEAFTKNAQLNQSISSQINSLVIGLTNLSEKIGTITFGPIIKNLLGLANTFTTFLEEAFDPEQGNKFIQGLFKTIGSFLSGPGLILITTGFLKIFTLVAKFAKDGFKTILDIGSQTEKIKNIEGGIVGLLSRDQQLRTVIASTTATQADKEAAVIAAIQRENALLTQQEQLLRSIATAAAQRGVSGYSQTGGFSGKGGKRFAEGYMEEEATAKMLGASPSVRAKQSKGTIGGQRFIMNNQETEIPNFGRNGDSAVIPHYANGFIPNYAESRKISIKRTGSPIIKKSNIPAERYNIDPSGYAFLAPSASSLTGLTTNLLGTASVAGQKYPFSLTKPVSGFSAKLSSSSIDKSAEPYDSRIEENITRNIGDAAFAYAKLLDPPSSNKSTKEDVFNRLATQRGAKGAIRSAVGTAFEAAVTSALSIQEAALGKGGDFDAPYINDEVAQLFGITGKYKKGDFKVSGSKGNVESFIAKIIKENPSMVRPKGKASGFIPNFNSVNKGVPVSQIRAHFDQSGNPIAVTNTRDEPNGLKDAIGREKQGIGMAARGFIPNYADSSISSFGKLQAALFALQLASTTLGDTQSEFNKKLGEGLSYLNVAATVLDIFPNKLKDLLAKKIVTPLAGAANRAAAGIGSAVVGTTDVAATLGGAAGLAGAATVIGASVGTALIAGGTGYLIGEYVINPILNAIDEGNIQQEKIKEKERVTTGKMQLNKDGLNPSALIRLTKSAGLDTTELQNAYTKAAADYNQEGLSEKRRGIIKERLRAAIEKQVAATAKANDFALADTKATSLAKMQKEILAARLDILNKGILNFKNILDSAATKLDQQKFLEGIASNVTTPTNTPYGEAAKAAIGIQQAQTLATESRVGFMQNFAGSDFSSIINSQKLLESGKTGSQISQDVFSAYMKNGAQGVGQELEKYVKEGLDPEDAKKFKDNVISSASTFRNNVADTMQKALNRETEVQNNLSELTKQIQEAGKTFMAEAASKIQELMSGPKLDPLALGNKFREAATLLGSGKKEDIAKGTNILASTADAQKAYEDKFGRDALINFQQSQGLTMEKTGLARGSAAISGLDLSGIKDSIMGQLSGSGRRTTLEALESFQQDPTKKDELVNVLKQQFGQLNLEGRKKGKSIVNTLESMGDVTKDPAMADLDDKKKAAIVELGTLAKTISRLHKEFDDTGIPDAMEALTKSVKDAATNLGKFTDFTKTLGNLSNDINNRLLDVEKKLGKTTL
jgi:TP901 family phage tail tape measure protein